MTAAPGIRAALRRASADPERTAIECAGSPPLTVALTADTAYLPPEAMEGYLRGLEELVCHEFIATGIAPLDASGRRS